MSWYMDLISNLLMPLIKISPFWAIVIISFSISLLTMFAFMIFTDQKAMKQLRDEVKELQKKMKEFKNNQKKVMEIQKQMMDKNMKYMKHSMKVTLFTLLPLILIFGWMNENLSYEPIRPNETFTITIAFDKNAVGTAQVVMLDDLSLLDNNATKQIDKEVKWHFKGEAGSHLIEWRAAGKTYTMEVLISNEQEFAPAIKQINDNNVKFIRIDYQKKILFDFLGMKFGWLGTYIIFSLIFSSLLKKILNVH